MNMLKRKQKPKQQQKKTTHNNLSVEYRLGKWSDTAQYLSQILLSSDYSNVNSVKGSIFPF